MKTGKGATYPRKTTIRNEPAMKKQPKEAAISKNQGGSPRKKLLTRQERHVTTPQKTATMKNQHKDPVISKKQSVMRQEKK